MVMTDALTNYFRLPPEQEDPGQPGESTFPFARLGYILEQSQAEILSWLC